MHTSQLLAIPGLMLLAATSPAAPRVRLPFTKYELSNGLTVILHEDHSLPIVAVNLWYRVGSKDEKAGRSGFAHLFEHLMFMGSKDVPGNQIDMIMEGAGGWNNASTGNDQTSYYDVAPSTLLETLLWIEADRLATLADVIGPKQLDLQRDVVRNERRQSYENRPYGRAWLAIPAEMYPPGHPYHWPVIGSHADLEAATVGDVRRFFHEYYVPNNTALVIAGDVKPAQARRWVERYFGWIPRAPDPEHARPQPAALGRPKALTLKDRVQLPRVYLVYHSPAAYQPGDAELDLLARVLASGKNSRLYKALVYEQRIAQDVSAFQESHRLGSLFYIVVTAKPGHGLPEIERAVDAEIARLRKAPPTQRELERARNGIETAFFASLESVAERADTLNQYEYAYGDPGAITKDLERYRSATAASLHEVAVKVLQPRARLVLRVVPGKPPRAREPAPTAGQPAGTAPLPPRPAKLPAYMATRPRLPRAGDFTVPRAVKLTLDNGIPLWVLERHELPLVSVALAVRGGAELDPAAREGLASLTSAMLDEGAGTRTALEIADEIDYLGADLATRTDRDASYVTLSVLRRNLDPALDIFADVALRPHFAEREWKRVQNDRLATLIERRDDPAYVARVVCDRVLYGEKHPYGRRLLGTEASVRAMKTADLRRFHDTWYAPGNAAFVVVGDVRAREVRDRLNHLFGAWKASPAARRTARPEVDPPRGGWAPLTIVDRPGAEQSEILLGRPGSRRKTPDYPALLVMNTILGGSFTSRLNQNLREKHGYTYGAHSSFEFRRGPGPFWAGAAVKSDTTEDSVRQFLTELKRLAGTTVPPGELRKAKTTVERSLPEKFQRNASVARLLADLWVHDLPLDYYGRFARRVAAVTADAVRGAARRYAAPGGAAIVIVGDREKVQSALEKLGFKQAVVRDAAGAVTK